MNNKENKENNNWSENCYNFTFLSKYLEIGDNANGD